MQVYLAFFVQTSLRLFFMSQYSSLYMHAIGRAKDDRQSVDIDDRMYAFCPPRGTLIYDLWLRMRWLHKRLCKFLMKP